MLDKKIKLKISKTAEIIFLPIFLFVSLFSPIQSHAIVFVPVNDLALNLTAESMLIVENQTAIVTTALASKEIGQIPGGNPLGQAAVNPGTGIALSLTSLDFAASTMAKILISRLTDSIVGWIDSGFQGQPAFVGDPASFLTDVADSVAGEFIEGSALDFMCEPFELQIRLALDYKYRSTFEDSSCRLSEVLNNLENFADFTEGGNFSRGGWDGWFQVIQPQNNPYGAYINAEAELGARIAGRQNIELLQLDWGSGFLSFQECLDPVGAPLSKCKNKGPIKTPGTVIESGLSDALGTEISELELADSFDRILAALLNQLVSRALSSSGLAGISNDSNSTGHNSDRDRQFLASSPQNLIATPITSTRINLDWSGSTTEDVRGYYVYRDGERIGKNDGKNNTFYPDSGLQPSTKYNYRVSAFIEEDNESARSNQSATTTLEF